MTTDERYEREWADFKRALDAVEDAAMNLQNAKILIDEEENNVNHRRLAERHRAFENAIFDLKKQEAVI
jgi:hypothetical protein